MYFFFHCNHLQPNFLRSYPFLYNTITPIETNENVSEIYCLNRISYIRKKRKGGGARKVKQVCYQFSLGCGKSHEFRGSPLTSAVRSRCSSRAAIPAFSHYKFLTQDINKSFHLLLDNKLGVSFLYMVFACFLGTVDFFLVCVLKYFLQTV